MQQIRQLELQLLESSLHPIQLLLGREQLAGQSLALAHQRADVLVARARLTDRLCVRIACSTQSIGLYLPVLSLLLERLESRHIEAIAATGEIARDRLGVGAQEFRIDRK